MPIEEPQQPRSASLGATDYYPGEINQCARLRQAGDGERFGEGVSVDEIQPDPAGPVHPDPAGAGAEGIGQLIGHSGVGGGALPV